jgi:hypothetical protein
LDPLAVGFFNIAPREKYRKKKKWERGRGESLVRS